MQEWAALSPSENQGNRKRKLEQIQEEEKLFTIAVGPQALEQGTLQRPRTPLQVVDDELPQELLTENRSHVVAMVRTS